MYQKYAIVIPKQTIINKNPQNNDVKNA